MMDEIGAEYGFQSSDPRLDQMKAAEKHTRKAAAKHGKHGFTVYWLTEAYPPALYRWLERFADSINTDGKVCNEAHVHLGTATTLFGHRPNVRYCHRCADHVVDRLAQRMQGNASTAWACDVCGNDSDLFDLTPFAVPVATVLVRGLGCGACLHA